MNNQGLGSGSDERFGSLAQLSQSLGTQRSGKASLSSSYTRDPNLLGSSLPRNSQRLTSSTSSSNPQNPSKPGGSALRSKEKESEKRKGKEKAEEKESAQRSSARRKKRKSSNKTQITKNASGGFMTRGIAGGGLPLTLGLGMGSGMGTGGNGRNARYGENPGGAASGREALGWIEGVRMLESDEEASDNNAAEVEGDEESAEEEEEVEESGASGLGKELATTAREWPRAMFEKVS